MLGCEQIKAVFEKEFRESYNVLLTGGAEEPVYFAAEVAGEPNRLVYTRDHAASALHEIAHWCLASPRQLQLKDWGHWYLPDGRNTEQQRRFQQVEARVQALEWILSLAAGRPFRESTDNLAGESLQVGSFRDAIHYHALRFCEQGLPERAGILFAAFAAARAARPALAARLFQRSDLDRVCRGG